MGILSGLFMVLVDNGVNIGVKRQQLMDCLVDYVENSPHFYKNVDKAAEGERADRKNRIVPAAGPGFRDLGRRGLKAVEETAASNETGPKEEKEELRDKMCIRDSPYAAPLPEGIHMLHLGGISDLHINPAEDQDICQIDQDQIPGLPLRDRKINAAGNRQEKYQQHQEQDCLLYTSLPRSHGYGRSRRRRPAYRTRSFH